MTTVLTSIDVEVPVRTAYNQWTQFEDFPHFMEGVEEVRQVTDKRLHWRASIAGAHREWDAEIVDQQPDKRIAWRSIEGAENAGVVMFEPVAGTKTRVTLQLDFDPEGFVEKAGDALGFVNRRVEGDLERFKEFIESRGAATGAWRGEIGPNGAEGTAGVTPTDQSVGGTPLD